MGNYWDDVINNRRTSRTTSVPSSSRGSSRPSSGRLGSHWGSSGATTYYDSLSSGDQAYWDSQTRSGRSGSARGLPSSSFGQALRYGPAGSGSGSTSSSRSGSSSGGRRSYSYGGGGGGGGVPTLSQANLDALLRMIGNTRPTGVSFDPLANNNTLTFDPLTAPDPLQFDRLEFEEYEGTPFYDFNDAMYDELLNQVVSGTQAQMNAGNRAYDDAAVELAAQMANNPYTNAQYATSPGTTEAMQRMISAQGGAGADAAAAVAGEAAQADAAFANVLASLGATQEARNQSTQRALSGDRRRFNENVRAQQGQLEMQVNFARMQARQQYEQERWQYGEQIARMNYEARMRAAEQNFQAGMQETLANFNAANDTRFANWQAANQATQANFEQANAIDMANWQAMLQQEMNNISDENDWRQWAAGEAAALQAANPNLNINAILDLIAASGG